MTTARNTFTVTVTKRRTGDTFTGTMTDDGLQSLYHVKCADGETRIASLLDTIVYH